MLTTHFTASLLPLNAGNTWTLPSRLGHMLTEATTLYGQRDHTWTPLGVEFGQGVPHIWFPENSKQVVIRLAPNAVNTEALACYQLAHECIHLLAPTGAAECSVIEEGLATVFSEEYVQKNFFEQIHTDALPYISAALKVRQLLALDSRAIRLLREIQPNFNEMTADTFAGAGLSNVPKGLVRELLSTFAS